MSRAGDLASLRMSASVRKLNAHLLEPLRKDGDMFVAKCVPISRPRLRQSSKPLMNANEAAFLEYLRATMPGAFVHAQALHLQIANGTRYTPDFMTYEPFSGRVCFWEVKGSRRIFDGAGEKLKSAAHLYKWAVFTLVWREGGEWQKQLIRP